MGRIPTHAAAAIALMALSAHAARAVSIVPGSILVAGTSGVGTGIIRVDPVSGQQTLLASGDFPDFKVDADRNLVAIEDGAVVRIDLSDGSRSTLVSSQLLANPAAVALDSNFLFVLEPGEGELPGTILEFDLATGGQRLIASDNRLGIDLEFAASDLFTLSLYERGQAGPAPPLEVDAATGQITEVEGGNYFYPTGLGPGRDNRLAITNGTFLSTYIYEIDPVTLTVQEAGRTFIVPSDCSFDDVSQINGPDIAANPISGRLLLAGSSRSGEGIHVLDQVCGSGTYLSETLLTTGDFHEIQVVAVPEPSTGLFFGIGLAGLAVAAARPTKRTTGVT